MSEQTNILLKGKELKPKASKGGDIKNYDVPHDSHIIDCSTPQGRIEFKAMLRSKGWKPEAKKCSAGKTTPRFS